MSLIGPYQRRAYQSDAPARMSALARRGGEIKAEESLRKGAAMSGMVGSIADIAGRTVMGIAQNQADAPKRELETLQIDAAKDELSRRKNLQGVMQMVAQLPPDEAIGVLRQEGFSKEADDLHKRVIDMRNSLIDQETKGYALAKTRMGQATDLLYGATIADTPEAKANAYQQVLPKVRALIGPQASAILPEEYDEATVQKALLMGSSQTERITARHTALTEARQDIADKRTAHTAAVNFVSRWAPTVDSQEEWDTMLEGVDAMGAPKETKAILGATYSPEAVANAVALGTTPARAATTPQVGSDADTIATWAREHGKTVDAMTSAEKNTALGARASALRKPDDPKDPDAPKQITRAQYNAALARKSSRLDALERQFREGKIDEVVLEAEKSRILRDFEDQTGPPSSAPLPWDVPKKRTMGDVARPGAPSAPPAPAAPSAPPKPSAAASSAPPPEVEQQLRDGGPGNYTLSDGSVWRVAPNGTVSRVK